MRWEPVLTERNRLKGEKAVPDEAEEMALVQGSTALEDMEKAGTAALEGEDVGEGRTEGGNFNRAVIQIYGIKSMFISFRLPS